MPFRDSTAYGPETLALLRTVLDQVWNSLSPIEQSHTLKSDLATRILNAAARGERDPVRLRAAARLRIAQPITEA